MQHLKVHQFFRSKYIYAFIKYTYPDNEYSQTLKDFVPFKQVQMVWTAIRRVDEYNEDVKYRFLDEAEKGVMEKYFIIHPAAEIISRECYAFDSYVEASKDLERRKNN